MAHLPSLTEDDLRRDPPQVEIVIRVHRSGAMSVAGNIENEAYACALIDAAKDSLRSYHARAGRARHLALVTPERDAPRVS
jgi:hypothetical protein